MGKKIKVGKQRRDKFYRLAKEAGLRSRAVFKLTQLNRKFDFLQKSHVLVDLCAAPGGWLQVAAKHMPMSSLIIGVDLAPIKAMPNIITLQNDITTESCRQAIKSQLQTWLADCVLHDGAPNVGKNWGHDAFMQAQLTLSALRLATEILKRGGWFVTKIFRSKDHPALVEVFKKLFKKVFVTKPEASRSESAEIYVVCRGYLKPDKVDPALLNPKHVFVELNLEPEKPKLNLMHPEKRRKKAEGYSEGDYTQHHRFTARQFVESDNHLEMLADVNEIAISISSADQADEIDRLIASHPSTTEEVKACCADVKVLGRKELRELLNWRKKIRQYLKTLKQQTDGPKPQTDKNEENEAADVDEEVELDEFVSNVKAGEQREAKKKRKKLMAEKRKLKQKLDLKMVIPGDKHDYAEEADLFNLRKIKNKEKSLGEMDMGDGASSSSSDSEANENQDKNEDGDYLSDLDFDEIGDIPESLVKTKQRSRNGPPDESLLVDFDDDSQKVRTKTDAWFEKEIFNDLIGDDDEDAEIEQVIASKNRSNTTANLKSAQEASNSTTTVTEPASKRSKIQDDSDSEMEFDSEDNTSLDSDDDDEKEGVKKTLKQQKSGSNKNNSMGEDFEIVPQDNNIVDKSLKLDAHGLALADLWLHSSKTRRDLVDSAYNRYTSNDENLPDWFATDERKHHRTRLPITKEAVEAYKLRMKEINARPIKKVAEAKARKKKRGIRRAEKAKKRAEAVIENSDMTESQKAQEVRKIYKQSMGNKKKPELTYVVAKKSQAGKRVRRPAGVSGRYKVVDHRLKKDLRKQKQAGGGGGGRRKKK